MKQCNTCKQQKPEAVFAARAQSRDGLGYCCRPCRQQKYKTLKEKDPTALAHRHSRASARQRGIVFDLSLEQYRVLLDTTECAICSITMNPRLTGKPCVSTQTVDRVDNEQGYVSTNVVCVCFGCNMRKGSLTLAQAEQIVGFLAQWKAAHPAPLKKYRLSDTGLLQALKRRADQTEEL